MYKICTQYIIGNKIFRITIASTFCGVDSNIPLADTIIIIVRKLTRKLVICNC